MCSECLQHIAMCLLASPNLKQPLYDILVAIYSLHPSFLLSLCNFSCFIVRQAKKKKKYIYIYIYILKSDCLEKWKKIINVSKVWRYSTAGDLKCYLNIMWVAWKSVCACAEKRGVLLRYICLTLSDLSIHPLFRHTGIKHINRLLITLYLTLFICSYLLYSQCCLCHRVESPVKTEGRLWKAG